VDKKIDEKIQLSTYMINWETNSSSMPQADLKQFEEETKNVNTTDYPEFKAIRDQV
jgi:hypothetical protein